MATAQKQPPAADKAPPSSLEAEQGVIGSLWLNPQLCDDVAMILTPDDFFGVENALLFRRTLEMHNEGKRVDALLLHERLKDRGESDEVGGLAYMTEISDYPPHAANAVHYAKIVKDKGTLRRLRLATTETLRDMETEGEDPQAVLNRAEERLFRVRDMRSAEAVHSIGDVLSDAIDSIDGENGSLRKGVKSGYGKLDSMTGGFRPGQVIIVAGRPGHGKSAIAGNIAEHLSLKEGSAVLFVSLEMSKLEVAERLLCSHASINSFKLRNSTISTDDRRKLMQSYNVLAKAKLTIDEGPNRTMTEIAAISRRLKRQNKLDVLMIDYLQLITPENKREPRQEQVASISRRLKTLAKEFDIPVICLAQLNRQAETTGEPQLSHLRESGAIEQDADNVMFVWRTGQDGTEGFLKVAKQRNGPVGKIKMIYQPEFVRFRELAQAEVEKTKDAFADYGLDGEFV